MNDNNSPLKGEARFQTKDAAIEFAVSVDSWFGDVVETKLTLEAGRNATYWKVVWKPYD